MTLETINTSIIDIIERSGRLYVFCSGGCDIFDLSTKQRVRQITATAVTCGAVTDDGVWFGTNGGGIYFAPLTGDLVSAARLFYATTADYVIGGDTIADMDGLGAQLIIAHEAGVDVISNLTTIYKATLASGGTNCAIGTTQISYADGTNLYTETTPTADWTPPNGTAATINSLQYSGDTLVCGTDAGMDVGGTTIGTTSAWGMLNGDYLIWADSSGRTITRVSDAATLATGSTSVALWVEDDLSASAAGSELDLYVDTLLIPGSDVAGVRRDWSLTCEITHSLLTLSPPQLAVNGVDVSITTTAITNGYRAEYAPESASASGARVSAVVSADDEDGNSHTVSWAWSCAVATNTVTDKPIPSLVCLTDIGLATYQADEEYGSVPVIWMDDQVSALYVDQDQCQSVGQGLIERDIHHERVLSITTPDVDLNGESMAALQKNDLVTVYCPALDLYHALAEVKAVQAKSVAKANETIYSLQVAIFERIDP